MLLGGPHEQAADPLPAAVRADGHGRDPAEIGIFVKERDGVEGENPHDLRFTFRDEDHASIARIAFQPGGNRGRIESVPKLGNESRKRRCIARPSGAD